MCSYHRLARQLYHQAACELRGNVRTDQVTVEQRYWLCEGADDPHHTCISRYSRLPLATGAELRGQWVSGAFGSSREVDHRLYECDLLVLSIGAFIEPAERTGPELIKWVRHIRSVRGFNGTMLWLEYFAGSVASVHIGFLVAAMHGPSMHLTHRLLETACRRALACSLPSLCNLCGCC